MSQYASRYDSDVLAQLSGYEHTVAYQKSYDLLLHLHKKCQKLPKYEKFSLQKDIRDTANDMIDEIEVFERTKSVSHLYNADRLKNRLYRCIRLAYDMKYSGMNASAYEYCAKQIAEIGKCIGGLIANIKGNG